MRLVLCGTLLLLASGCAKASGRELRLPAREPFIALERDFQSFSDWQRLELGLRPSHGDSHAAGEAFEYTNQLPPPGSKGFPVGTILVKTMTKDAKKQDVFAMVKRGGGYNAHGAIGWEWFELQKRQDGSYAIKWRGINPPNDEGYGGDAAGGCNGCHQLAQPNDYVLAPAFALAKL